MIAPLTSLWCSPAGERRNSLQLGDRETPKSHGTQGARARPTLLR
jgi:hypothetical protein